MTGRGKGKEVQLQVEIENQEDWEEQIAKEGLLVVDVYQDWCGPCKAMVPIFKRIKNETQDDLLRFATAKADSVEALERYRGRCEPAFLFYAGGVLVEVTHGADAPTINRSIVEQLAIEHTVLDAGGTRVEVVDRMFPAVKKQTTMKDAQFDDMMDKDEDDDDDLSTDDEAEDAKRMFIEKEVSVLILTSAVHDEKKVKDVQAKIKGAGFDVLFEGAVSISQDDAFHYISLSRFFQERDEVETEVLAKLLSTDASYIMVLTKGETGKNVVRDLKELVGPESFSMATEFAPLSLRAMVGINNVAFCGVICAEAFEDAQRAIELFIPTFVSQKISVTNLSPPREHTTVAIIRPTLMKTDHHLKLLATIQELGFRTIMKKEVVVTADQAASMYKQFRNEGFYDDLIENMTSGTSLVLLLSNGSNTVVNDFLEVLGPFEASDAGIGSLRQKFQPLETDLNQIHGSLTQKFMEREKEMFFPMQQVLLMIKPSAFNFKDQIMQVLREEGFLTAGRKMLMLSNNQVQQIYSTYQGFSFMDSIIQEWTSGMSCLMILSRNDCLTRLQHFLGYVTDTRNMSADGGDDESAYQYVDDFDENNGPDPTGEFDEMIQKSRAKSFNVPLYYPDQFNSLQAVFGIALKNSSLHVSHTIEEAQRDIKDIFGDVRFEKDGHMKKKKKDPQLRICETKGEHEKVELNVSSNNVNNQANNPINHSNSFVDQQVGAGDVAHSREVVGSNEHKVQTKKPSTASQLIKPTKPSSTKTPAVKVPSDSKKAASAKVPSKSLTATTKSSKIGSSNKNANKQHSESKSKLKKNVDKKKSVDADDHIKGNNNINNNNNGNQQFSDDINVKEDANETDKKQAEEEMEKKDDGSIEEANIQEDSNISNSTKENVDVQECDQIN